MPSPRPGDSLAPFLRRLAVAVMVAVGVWVVLRPAYNQALAWTAQGVARLLESPPAASIIVQGSHAIIGRTDLRADSGRLQYTLAQITFNLVPFLALALALPRPLGRGRIGRLGGGLVVLFASHVLALVVQVKAFYAFSLGPWSIEHYGAVARTVIGGLRFFFEIPVAFGLPLLLWVATYPEEVARFLRLPDRERS